MKFFDPFWVAISTYSAFPAPQVEWNERNTGRALCFFPAVGVLCGGALWGWHALCGALGVGGVLFAAAAVCLPLLITGGIHMDGFADTVDALASHQSRERKLEILKDSHCGAFAVIYCGAYLLLSFGLFHELYGRAQILSVCPAFVFSRSLSALCAVTLPNARGDGMLRAFTQNVQRLRTAAVMAVLLMLSGAGMIWLAPASGAAGAALGLLWTAGYRRLARRQFGGVTGDTAGFFLQLCELAALAGVWMGSLL